MMRPTSLVLMLLAAAAGGALFHVSFEVTALDDRLSTLNRDIRTDREAIHVLRAEWSFLNQPERLEELARRHLDLQPVSGAQLTGADTLPIRPDSIAPSLKAQDDPSGLNTAIALHAGAPKAKPTAPSQPKVVNVATTATHNVHDIPQARSLDDILRDVVASASPAGTQ